MLSIIILPYKAIKHKNIFKVSECIILMCFSKVTSAHNKGPQYQEDIKQWLVSFILYIRWIY